MLHYGHKRPTGPKNRLQTKTQFKRGTRNHKRPHGWGRRRDVEARKTKRILRIAVADSSATAFEQVSV